LKYQKIIESARERDDYTSLGVVQQQVLDWYQPVKTAIEKEQANYLKGGKHRKKDMVKYGPHLCTLSAEKLAILVSHETILHCLTCKNPSGATLATTAKRIGVAVEAELNVQRLLQKRAQEKKATAAIDEFGKVLQEFVKEDATILIDEQAAALATAVDDEDDPNHSQYMYAANHLQSFTDEIFKDGTKKRRVRMEYASSRARALLNNADPWNTIDHVKLGCALLEILLNTATTQGASGRREKSFTYHKTWADNKITGWILAHDELFRMVMEDSLTNNNPFSSRHKPMILPPNPWVSPREGGYKWLKVDIMRTNGSKIQSVSMVGFTVTPCSSSSLEITNF
jgi:DNA-directed RNA polymerase